MPKTALITGAALGIGFELSLLLAKDSYDLILVDINATKLEIAKNHLQNNYTSNITTLVKDLSMPNAAIEIFDNIKNDQIDILINNAGFGLYGAFSNTNWQRESEMLYLHTHTITHLTKLVLQGMLDRNNGMVLNLSSLAAFQPGPFMAIYYASKAFILSFSEAIANELKGTGVTVTALCPGQTRTSFQKVVSATSFENKINFNIASPKVVAKYGYKAMLKGKTVAVPGKRNKLLMVMSRLMPRDMVTSIVRKLQKLNRASA